MKHKSDEIREAIGRLAMCANRDCIICKYKTGPVSEMPSTECKERISAYMNMLADECLRGKGDEK